MQVKITSKGYDALSCHEAIQWISDGGEREETPFKSGRGHLRSSLPHLSKIGARQYGLLAEEQMRRRGEDIRYAQELSRLAKEKRDENEYQETKILMFNCIANGVLNMNKIATVICSLKGRNALNRKAYDEFVHSEQAMTAIPRFDDLNVRDDKNDIWYNILADRLQCEIDRARIHQNAMKMQARSYYRLQEVKFTGDTTIKKSDENFEGREQG
ncbi:unnamed protein product [Cylicocyclus nassatus]|uniref:Uncharacterized protein n=1 Tax=Cylicocyclus nassatus TaxID=53992 RepID=A0AA36GL59_CYLNA|nr:unnamed protein product [Cylicocyclus nassatus]